MHDASKTAGVDYMQDAEDDNESEAESITNSDDDESESSKSSTKLNETANLEERTEVLGDRQVAFGILASNNIPTDDINTISKENDIPEEEDAAINDDE